MTTLAGGQRIWLLDTSSLLSMAVDVAISAAVLDEIGADKVVVIDVVLEELEYRAAVSGTADLARNALAGRLPSWVSFGTENISLTEIAAAQEDVADGRVLTDDSQHWAEATIIAMGRQSAASAAGYTSIKVLLSEDYDARRVASRVTNMLALSIHGLFADRVRGERMTAQAAAELSDMLHKAGRGPVVSADDFVDRTGRRLGRVGQPRWRS